MFESGILTISGICASVLYVDIDDFCIYVGCVSAAPMYVAVIGTYSTRTKEEGMYKMY